MSDAPSAGFRTWMCLVCGINWTCPECGARKEDFEMVEI
jgi:rubredoxin